MSCLPSQISPNSIAARDGRIREGDRILQVPQHSLLLHLTCPAAVLQHRRGVHSALKGLPAVTE